MKRFNYVMMALVLLGTLSGICWGYYIGKADTMRSFQLRECWVSEPSMDINCTMNIGDL